MQPIPSDNRAARDLGRRLSAAIEAAAIDESSAARRCGVSRNAIRQHRAGGQLPSLRILLRYARSLGVSVGWLVGEDEVRGPSR